MASENAKAVAQEVVKTIGNNRKVVLRQIIKKKGYSPVTADNPKVVTNTKSYQEVIEPVVKQMEDERLRLVQAISNKNLAKEKYRDLIDGIDKLTKNIQLLSGKATSNVAVGYKNMSDDELYRLAEGSED